MNPISNEEMFFNIQSLRGQARDKLYPQHWPPLQILNIAEEKGYFSYKNLTAQDGHRILNSLQTAIAARCTTVAAGLIIRGLPVSQQNIDLAIEKDLPDVVLAIAQRAVPLDATSIIFCIKYACQKKDDELLGTLFLREDVKSEHVACALQQHCLNGEQEEAEYLLREVRRSCHSVSFQPFSPPPLHRACIAGDWKRVKELLIDQTDIQRVWPLTGQTAVQLAAAFGQDVIVNELLTAHADCTLLVGTKEFRVNRALLSSRSRYFKVLFEKFNEKDKEIITIKDTPADAFGELLQFLSTARLHVTPENVAAFATLTDQYELTGVPLDKWLDGHELKDQVQALERLPQAPKTLPQHFEFAAAEKSTYTNEAELLEALATNKYVSREDISYACDQDWKVALSFAMQNGYGKQFDLAPDVYKAIKLNQLDIARLLLEGGVDVVDFRGTEQETILHAAVHRDIKGLVSLILQKVPPEKKQQFIDAICEHERYGISCRAIDLAVLAGHDHLVPLLRAEGARPLPTTIHTLVVHNASYLGTELYLNCFSEEERRDIVNLKDPRGRTALQVAFDQRTEANDFESDNYEVDHALIKLIMDSGADLSIRNEEGLTPIEHAFNEAQRDPRLVDLLGMMLLSLPADKRQKVVASVQDE